MAIKVYAEIGKLNHIGRVGENKAETLIFDVSKIIDNFGDSGVFSLFVNQNGNLTTVNSGSNLSYNSNNKTVEWTITSQYTTGVSRGKCQIVYKISSSEVITKSEVYDIVVTEAYEEGD